MGWRMSKIENVTRHYEFLELAFLILRVNDEILKMP